MFKRRKDEPTPPEAHPHRPEPHDSGVGVPPFRPAFKEQAAMARMPFNAAPAPNPNAPPAPQPTGSPGPGQGSQTPPHPQQQPRPQPGPGGSPFAPLNQPAQAPRTPVRRTLVVGHGISVSGLVQDAERLVVEGTVEAAMINAQELSIAPGGMFKGEVEVEDAEVAGTIDGTLTARGNLVVRGTGRVLGTARCRRLQVEDGGQITGRIEMITEALPPRPDRAA